MKLLRCLTLFRNWTGDYHQEKFLPIHTSYHRREIECLLFLVYFLCRYACEDSAMLLFLQSILYASFSGLIHKFDAFSGINPL